MFNKGNHETLELMASGDDAIERLSIAVENITRHGYASISKIKTKSRMQGDGSKVPRLIVTLAKSQNFDQLYQNFAAMKAAGKFDYPDRRRGGAGERGEHRDYQVRSGGSAMNSAAKGEKTAAAADNGPEISSHESKTASFASATRDHHGEQMSFAEEKQKQPVSTGNEGDSHEEGAEDTETERKMGGSNSSPSEEKWGHYHMNCAKQEGQASDLTNEFSQ